MTDSILENSNSGTVIFHRFAHTPLEVKVPDLNDLGTIDCYNHYYEKITNMAGEEVSTLKDGESYIIDVILNQTSVNLQN